VWRRDFVLRSACGESDKPKEDLQEELAVRSNYELTSWPVIFYFCNASMDSLWGICSLLLYVDYLLFLFQHENGLNTSAPNHHWTAVMFFVFASIL